MNVATVAGEFCLSRASRIGACRQVDASACGDPTCMRILPVEPVRLPGQVHEHQRGDVHDLRVEAAVSQPLLDREPADGVHLIERCDIDAVAVAQVGEQHVITLAEVVDAGSVQQEQVGPEPGRYLLIHHVGVSRVVGGPLPRLVTRPAAAG